MTLQFDMVRPSQWSCEQVMVASMPVPSWANFSPVSCSTCLTASYTNSPSMASALLALYFVCATATIPTRSLIYKPPFLLLNLYCTTGQSSVHRQPARRKQPGEHRGHHRVQRPPCSE